MYGHMTYQRMPRPFSEVKNRIFFKKMVLGKLNIHMQNNEVELHPNNIYKNELSTGQRCKHRVKTIKLSEENIR